MRIAFSWILAVAGAFVVIFVAWRWSSRRHSLPCPVWLRWFVELDNPFAKTNRAAVIVKNLDLKPGMWVLDVGCGPGRVTVPAAQVVGETGRVVALDIQSGMLARAQEKAKQQGLTNIDFVCADIGEEKLEKEKFDRVLLVTVLGEIPDRERAMRRIFSVLKPGGILSVTELIFDPHFQRRATVIRFATAAGFELCECYGNRFAFTLKFKKPRAVSSSPDTHSRLEL